MPDTISYTESDAGSNTIADSDADTGADFGADVESDERAKCVADAESHICAHAGADTVTDATRTSLLRDERLRQMDSVLKDVWRWYAAAHAICGYGASARRQGVRQLSPSAGLQLGGVHVRREKLQCFRSLWCMFGVVR